MMRDDDSKRDDAPSLREAIDDLFGRWPAWPWSMLALILAGGIAGAAAAPAVRAARLAGPAALGTFACAGYGVALAALGALVPRVVRLLRLRPGVARRPATVDESWWPLRLLPAALASTPRLRRTEMEFRDAVAAAAAEARGILADRLWPVWGAAFVVPVLGLMTAWQNGGRVRLQAGGPADAAGVFPDIVSQVSPPMVATIAAALAVMVVTVAVDQWTKSLLQRWRGIVTAEDGRHPAVDPAAAAGESGLRPHERPVPPSEPMPEPTPPKLPKHPLGPDRLGELWDQSGSSDR